MDGKRILILNFLDCIQITRRKKQWEEAKVFDGVTVPPAATSEINLADWIAYSTYASTCGLPSPKYQLRGDTIIEVRKLAEDACWNCQAPAPSGIDICIGKRGQCGLFLHSCDS
jgi:hypothetical protein